jgi:hypothetical protein
MNMSEDMKVKIRQKFREIGTTEPLGNKQPWTIFYDALEPMINELLVTLNEKCDYVEVLRGKIDLIKEASKETSVLSMFAYQGPPTANWLKTEGRYWAGYNKKAEEIRTVLDSDKISSPILVSCVQKVGVTE